MATDLFPAILPDDDADAEPQSVGDMIDAGICPWCPETQEFENLAAHASQAHPQEWRGWTED